MRSVGFASLRARLAIALAIASMLVPVQGPVTVSAAVPQLLPDLQLEPLFGLYIQETVKHRFLLLTVHLTPLTQTEPPTDRRAAKIGFCLADMSQMPEDQRPPNSAPAKTFNNCGSYSSTHVRMGISVGWGDDYEPYYKYQWVEVTGLPAGDYRLCALIDAQSLWLETSKDNNSL